MKLRVWLCFLLAAACGVVDGPEDRTDAGTGAAMQDGATDAGLDAGRREDLPSSPDWGLRDGGAPDAGAADRGPLDVGPSDAGAHDVGSPDAGPPPECDYRFGADGALRIEAEDLPLNASWQIGTDEPGYSGSGYIVWTGSSSNNRPGNGLMEIAIRVPEAGRYRLQWRNRIGKGNNTTEHNDTWLRFTDAVDYYGKKGPSDEESRRYPKPQCEDDDFMDAIRSRTEISEARCAAGSTRDGWMKVYSSGARDWRWSTRTSDNDAHDIFVEYDAPGVYTVQMSARADFHLIDRIVLHREEVERSVVEAEMAPTPCR